MELSTVWFIIIAVLWTGYFVLEGFDFGVGMLLPVLGRGTRRRRHREAPPRHGQHHRPGLGRQRGVGAHRRWRDLRRLPALVRHDVQRLLPAPAADPRRPHRPQPRLRLPRQARPTRSGEPRWDTAIFVGSLVARPAVGRRADQPRARPADRRGQGVHRQPFTLLNPVSPARRAGHASACSSPTARSSSRSRRPARSAPTPGRIATRTGLGDGGARRWPCWASSAPRSGTRRLVGDHGRRGRRPASARSSPTCAAREGWAFVGTFVAIALTVATYFLLLFPDVMPSSTNAGLVAHHRPTPSSTHYTLTIMTWVAAGLHADRLLYQSWTYWVFRKRIGTQHIPRGGRCTDAPLRPATLLRALPTQPGARWRSLGGRRGGSRAWPPSRRLRLVGPRRRGGEGYAAGRPAAYLAVLFAAPGGAGPRRRDGSRPRPAPR